MTLIAAGGKVDEAGERTIFKRLLQEARGEESHVCLVTTATMTHDNPDEPKLVAARYRRLFESLGADNISVFHIADRQQAQDPAVVAGLRWADVIFFTGGDQLKLTSILGGTPFLDEVRRMNKIGVVVGGTSAGAVMMSELMICDGDPQKGMNKGENVFTLGLRFVANAVFDSHFSQLGRQPRLRSAVCANPGMLGVGLDEDTAIVIANDGDSAEVIGSGAVTLFDATRSYGCNITQIKPGQEIKVSGIVETVLTSGARFSIQKKCGL